ncbi:MAG: nucleotidyltransferase domain-containing protein [Coriobacteriales bacterium]|nr:nucleotidyltransferase domain-containing protein [Coriobacteriales bacterium]
MAGTVLKTGAEVYFDIEEQVDAIRSAIINTVPTEQIYLFGSYVTGTFSPEHRSDLDVYVVLNDGYNKSPIEAMQEIGLAIYDKKSIPTDILANKRSRFDELAQVTTLEREIVNNGRLIYAKQ